MRGKYVSVELVREVENGARVEWRMATSSDAGGNIPRFMTNSALPKSIAEDVPSFLRWMLRRYNSPSKRGSTDGKAAKEAAKTDATDAARADEGEGATNGTHGSGATAAN